jgi:hypothetical protein
MSFMSDAVREWAYAVGREQTTRQWLLSDYDTWEPNPFYVGPEQGHPGMYDAPLCTVWLTFKEAAKEAASSAKYMGRSIPLERYRDRWVVRYEA